MIGFGDFDKLMQGIDIANKVSSEPMHVNHAPQRYAQAKPMFPQRQTMTEGVNRQHAPVDDGELDALLGSIQQMDDLFESAAPSPMNQPSAVDSPKPRPAVSHDAFVNAAIKAKQTAEVPSTKQKVEKQNIPDLIKMKDEFNAKLATKGAAFKQCLTENLSTDDNAHLIEAVSKIFDLIVLESE